MTASETTSVQDAGLPEAELAEDDLDQAAGGRGADTPAPVGPTPFNPNGPSTTY